MPGRIDQIDLEIQPLFVASLVHPDMEGIARGEPRPVMVVLSDIDGTRDGESWPQLVEVEEVDRRHPKGQAQDHRQAGPEEGGEPTRRPWAGEVGKAHPSWVSA